MLTKANLSAFVATILLASVCVVTQARATQGDEDAARQKMVGTQAPELKADHWLNTDGKDLSMKGLKGKVVVLDFFTYH